MPRVSDSVLGVTLIKDAVSVFGFSFDGRESPGSKLMRVQGMLLGADNIVTSTKLSKDSLVENYVIDQKLDVVED